MGLNLKIVSPEKVEYTGEAASVEVPGTKGRFVILNDHAPIISSLRPGVVTYVTMTGERRQVPITGGFVEVQKNEVNLCVEVE